MIELYGGIDYCGKILTTDDHSVRDSERKAAIRHFDTDQVHVP